MIHLYQTRTRWIPVAAAAVTAHIAFLLLILRVEPEYVPKPAPFIALDYITLPPPPKPEPVRPKPQPVVKPPEPVQEVIPEPVPEPEPSVEPVPEPEPAPAVQEAPPQPSPPPVPAIVSDLSVLDNKSFAPVHNPHPAYPPLARAAGLEGAVTVELLVGADGRVTSFSILKTEGHQQFALNTSKAVRHWRFPPPRVRGQATMVKYVYTVRFRLE